MSITWSKMTSRRYKIPLGRSLHKLHTFVLYKCQMLLSKETRVQLGFREAQAFLPRAKIFSIRKNLMTIVKKAVKVCWLLLQELHANVRFKLWFLCLPDCQFQCDEKTQQCDLGKNKCVCRPGYCEKDGKCKSKLSPHHYCCNMKWKPIGVVQW